MTTDEQIMAKLNITVYELNSLFVANPVNGFVGTEVAERIACEHGLDLTDTTLGFALAQAGILDDDQASYLDDAD